MSTARKKRYSKIMNNEKSTTRESATRMYNKKKVKLEKSSILKKCNTKKVQHEAK